MAYTNKQFPNDPDGFPQPQRWLVWVAGHTDPTMGSLRNFDTLFKARNQVKSYNRTSMYHYDQATQTHSSLKTDKFTYSWTIYEWVDGAWIPRHQGFAGEVMKDSPLYQAKIKKGDEPDLSSVALVSVEKHYDNEAARLLGLA